MKNTDLLSHFLKNTDLNRNWSRKEIFTEITSLSGFDRKHAYNWFRNSIRQNSIVRVSRGKYSFNKFGPLCNSDPTTAPTAAPAPSAAPAPIMNFENAAAMNLQSVSSVIDDEIYIPSKDSTFIKWGEFSKIKKIIDSKLFFPTYVVGMSGNGKTMMIEQACAILKREYIRVQISPETDEDDLIGGFRLINGDTVFQKGPVVKAMERGCILLIDEIDRSTNKIMCLQGVLEGKPILLKKTGQVITPADGFNVIATANTKGRGSDEGRYTAAGIIDDAFLERFVAVIDQNFPPYATEKKILFANAKNHDINDDEFIDKLVAWSNVIRKTFDAEGIEDVVSTRRLCHIIKAFSIFEDRMTSIKMCISRFEEETRDAFLDLYTKIDESTIDDDGEIIDSIPSADGAPPLEDEESPF